MGTRTSGSEGGGEQTTARKRGTAARLRPHFSILQRKALTPNDFGALDELAKRVMAFQDYYQQIARPFDWRFTRADLSALLARLGDHEPFTRLAA